MIIDTLVAIKICPINIRYWKNLGYDNIIINSTLNVYPKDLPKKSNVILNCVCDKCQTSYKQRASRDCNICSKCKIKERMKNNTYGKKNSQYNTINKDTLKKYIDNRETKSNIAKKHNVTISVVNRWLREYNINLLPYFGRKYFKTQKEENDAVIKCNNFLENNKSANISEVSRNTKIPIHILKSLIEKQSIKLESQFNLWKKTYENMESNIEYYIQENNKKTLKHISQENNVSVEQLKKLFHSNNVPVKLHSYNKSKGELECKKFIQNLGFDCFSMILSKIYEIDCYVPNIRFGVEYCGEYWHRYQPSKANKYYHKNKYILCEKNNIELMTIFAHEWETKQNLIESMIRSRLGLNTKIHGRSCEIQQITSNEANNFHKQNHMSGSLNSSVNIGLFKNNELISVISFIKSRFDKKYDYEIGRFSTKMNITIVGGLSKLFTYFVKTYKPKSVVTYADLRFGSGKAYKKIGFEYVGTTVPNYFYFKKNGYELENRMRYQKEKLKKFASYDVNKTEFEIMEKENYYRLYDCGNKKYVWKK